MSDSPVLDEIRERIAVMREKRDALADRLAPKLAPIEADIAALERVLCVLGGTKKKKDKIRPLDCVQAAVDAICGEFGIHEIASWINMNQPDVAYRRSAIYAAIHTLETEGSIEKTVVPSGRRAAKYRRVKE